MATPTFRAAGTWSFTANNVATPFTTTPGAPAGKASGDLLICVCESRNKDATVATPTGWTLPTGFPVRSGTASGGAIYVFTRIADGTATDTPSPVWSGLTTGTTGDASGAGILSYSVGTATQDGTVTSTDITASTTTSTISTLATSLPETLVVGIAMKLLESSAQTSTVSGRTERADNSTTSGTGHIIEVCDVVQVAPGTTPACTVTWSATTSSRALVASIGLAAPMPAPADTGLTVSDSIVKRSILPVTDTGLTITTTITRGFPRQVTDTGLTVTDSPQKSATHLLTDTGLAFSDSLVKATATFATTTGLTVTDSIHLISTNVHPADTGLTISDTLISRQTRKITDTGLTLSDTPLPGKGLTDSGIGNFGSILRPQIDASSTPWFGSSIAISRDYSTLVGGAPAEGVPNIDYGRAYVYRNGRRIILAASNQASHDNFGIGVAASSDGSIIVVGRQGESALGHHTGAIYIYSGANWTTETIITPSDGAGRNNWFGYSVAISDDGSIIAVAAPQDASGLGAVYVYSGASYATETKLTTSSSVSNQFGAGGVALSADGSVVVVGDLNTHRGGAPLASGEVSVFNGASWGTETILTASDASSFRFFGQSVDISSDGATIVVGAIGANSNKGAAYICTGTNWATQAEITQNDPTNSQQFGWSVAISNDVVAVGCNPNNQKQSAYLFQKVAGTWTQWQEFITGTTEGNSLYNDIALAWPVLAVGASQQYIDSYGFIYVYEIDSIAAVKTTAGVITITDTGLTITDSVASARTHLLTDTGVAISDAVPTSQSRNISDVGVAVSDSLASLRVLAVTDSGLTVADSTASLRFRPLTDSGLTVTESIVSTLNRPLADTGLTVTDSVTSNRARPLSDTGLTNTDSIASSKTSGTILITDTGVSIADAIASSKNRPISDVGLALSESIVGSVSKTITDTGLAFTATLASLRNRQITDTSLTVSENTQKSVTHFLTNTGLSLTDSVIAAKGGLAVLSDTGLTLTDSIQKYVALHVTNTGLSLNDSINAFRGTSLSLIDQGLTITDSLRAASLHVVTDAGITITDSISASSTGNRLTVSDTGLTLSDFLTNSDSRFVSDIGLTLTDSITAVANRTRRFTAGKPGGDQNQGSPGSRWSIGADILRGRWRIS